MSSSASTGRSPHANRDHRSRPHWRHGGDALCEGGTRSRGVELDRKSTRLNSSHQIISYAVFCLKKKNTNTYNQFQQTASTITSHHDAASTFAIQSILHV